MAWRYTCFVPNDKEAFRRVCSIGAKAVMSVAVVCGAAGAKVSTVMWLLTESPRNRELSAPVTTLSSGSLANASAGQRHWRSNRDVPV